MQPAYTTDAICLKTWQYREADKLACFYSRDHGRLQALVKGGRKVGGKLSGVCELLSCAEIHVNPGRSKEQSLQLLTQYQPINTFPYLRQHLPALACGMVAAEWVYLLCQDHDENSASVYDGLIHLLLELNAVSPPSPDLCLSELSLLQLYLLHTSGYQPCLDVCGVSHEPIDYDTEQALSPVWIGFSPELGSVVSYPHREWASDLIRVSYTTIHALSTQQFEGLTRKQLLKIQRFLNHFFAKKIEKSLQGLDFLFQVIPLQEARSLLLAEQGNVSVAKTPCEV